MASTTSLSPTAAGRALDGSARQGGVDRSVIWLRGEHDISTVAGLSGTFSRAIAMDETDLVVDLSGVTFMGAETVGVIARARHFLGQRSRAVELRRPSARATRVLDLCGVGLCADQARISDLPMRRANGHVSNAVPRPAS